MTTSLSENGIMLTGQCGVEEVETLIDWLDTRPDLPVDVSEAASIHTALWQALMVFRPKLVGAPMSAFISNNLMPGLMTYWEESRET